MRTSYSKHIGFCVSLELLVWDLGGGLFIEILMTCMGHYEIEPHVYEKFIEKTMYTYLQEARK